MDMALDDIIKNKNIHKTGIGAKIMNKRKQQQAGTKRVARKTIVDARLKIIQKNRAKIRDARDKLAEITRASGDARKKLVRKQLVTDGRISKSQHNKPIYRNRPLRSTTLPSRSRTDHRPLQRNALPSRSMHLPNAPRGYIDYDNMKDLEEEESIHLSRTVQNDMARYGSSSHRSHSAAHGSVEYFDPFDVYEVQKQPRLERKTSIDYDMSPPRVPREIMRRDREVTHSSSKRHYLPESASHLSYEMRNRLEHAPDPHASMGIFANSNRSSDSGGASSGYRIVVSNLHSNVTQLDIKELFEDIGELYDSRIVRPGVAEVIYKKLDDAELAVDTYHNRQLDGQPMKCLLVNPRSSNKPTAPASSSYQKKSGKTPLEIDIDALHKVLFRRN